MQSSQTPQSCVNITVLVVRFRLLCTICHFPSVSSHLHSNFYVLLFQGRHFLSPKRIICFVLYYPFPHCLALIGIEMSFLFEVVSTLLYFSFELILISSSPVVGGCREGKHQPFFFFSRILIALLFAFGYNVLVYIILNFERVIILNCFCPIFQYYGRFFRLVVQCSE